MKPGSFFPAPHVDAALLHLTPRPEALALDFKEWDMLIRLLFARRQAQVKTRFAANSTMNLLEHNYRTWCSLHRVSPSSAPFAKLIRDALDESGVAGERVMLVDTSGFVRLYVFSNSELERILF